MGSALHDQELRPILDPDVVEGADVRVIQAGDDPGFGREPLATLPIPRKVFRQYLERHDAVQPGIDRSIDFAHAAGSNQ